MADDLGPRALAVSADVMNPDSLAEGRARNDLATPFLNAIRPNIGLGRPCKPEDVAAAVAFLASERAGFITGVNLRVDGDSVATP